MALIRVRQGDISPAKNMINELKQRSGTGMPLAMLYTALGDKEHALDALENAYEEQAFMLFVAVDKKLQPLHGDPRFENLVSRLNLRSAEGF